MNRAIKILMPTYMKEFRCIGSECEDSCCSDGWDIYIDCATYHRYMNVKDKEVRVHIKEHVKIDRASTNKERYAVIKMKEDGDCPFLNEQKLCRIQFSKGAEYLSNVCAVYPRIINIVDDMYEISAAMSCPEAARLALDNPEPMEFEVEESNEPVRMVISRINIKDKCNDKHPEYYFWEIRFFTIALLQNRKYRLWERLIILGLFFKKLQKHIDEGNLCEIPKLINEYTEYLEDDTILEILSEIPTKNSVQMTILLKLVNERYEKGLKNARYRELVEEFFKGISYTPDNKDIEIEKIEENYAFAYHRYYEPFMKNNEYILENYLVNYVFKNLFPLNNKLSCYTAYAMMILNYSLIKLHLIGIAGYRKGLSIETVIQLVQVMAKTVEHNQEYMDAVAQVIKDNGFNTMTYMAILIRS
ncbi:MAG: flagellin lysine-N-methylase [Bacillota bacterium]